MEGTEQTVKPDWKDAPEWANWLAMDKDCTWVWYLNRPKIYEEGGIWDGPYLGMWEPVGKQKYPIGINEDWKQSLEQRPKQ